MAMMVVGCGGGGGSFRTTFSVPVASRREQTKTKTKGRGGCDVRSDETDMLVWRGVCTSCCGEARKKKDSRYKDSYRERERKKVRLDRRPWVEARW